MALDFQPDEDGLDFQLDFQEDDEPKKKRSLGQKALGVLDTAMGMAAGTPAQIAGGVAGLSTLLSGQGLDAAANKVKSVQEKNFGLGEYKPFSEAGTEYTQNVGEVLQKPVKYAGDLGYKIGGELGRTNAEIAAEGLMNIIDPTIGLGFAAKAVRGRKMKPMKGGDTSVINDVIKDDALTKKVKEDFAKADAGFQADLFGDTPRVEVRGTQDSIKPGEAGAGPLPEERASGKNRRQMEIDFAEDMPSQINVDRTGEAVRSDVNPNDLYARDQMAERLQAELDAMAKAEAPLQNQTSLEGPDGQMSLFDQPDVMGQRNQFNGGELGDWRIDENGMPVKVDKSLEALNMEQPLQRGLFGDELGPAQGQNQGMTQALDSIPPGVQNRNGGQFAPGTTRGAALNSLGADGRPLNAGNDLMAAVQEANGPKLPFEDQTMFDPKNPLPTERMGSLPPEPQGGGGTSMIDPPLPSGPTQPGQVVAASVQKLMQGGDPIEVLASLPDNVSMRQVLDAETVVRSQESQTLRNAEILPPEARPPVVDSVETPRSPETIAAKEKQRAAAQHIPVSDPRLSQYEAVKTVEEAKALLEKQGYKDNAPGVVGRNLGSGANWASAMTNNPLIKFANTVFRDARTAAERFSRDYVTAPDGIAPTWTKLNVEQRNAVRQALQDGDRHQFRVTDETMAKLGFTDQQRNFVNKYYESNDAMFKRWNEVSAEMGLKPIDRREGHVPGIFKGAYKALVTDSKGVQGVISVDSRYELAAAKKWFEKNRSDLTIVDQGRKGLADYKQQSDIFSGVNDVMQLLAQNDPRFAEVQAMVSEAIKHGNNSIYAFNKHELSKKGVIGNEGNKPWLDADKNTDAWFRSMIQYFEEGALHHELQKPLADVKSLAADPELNMPKTMKYLDSYTKHVTGQNASNPVANFANAVLDTIPRVAGYGPGPALKLAGGIKNNMSQLFMGWGNWVFTAAQMTQPLQTGAPMLALIGGRLGATVDVPRTMLKGGSTAMLLGLEKATGKRFDSIPDYMRTAWDYAKDRGMVNFSEMERAYQGSQSAAGRAKDKVAEFNMKVGEVGTRAPMFLSFVEMLHSQGVPLSRALEVAENATQLSMIDYHQWERPQLYGKMGAIGNFAGGLTTFKHGYAGQLGVQGKEVMKGNPLPLAASAAAMIAVAGITGMPFYDELDELHGLITDKFFGKRSTIRDTALANLPEWTKSGVVANATGVAVQSKFSSANMIPDYDRPGAALSPQLAAAAQLIADGIDVIKNGDDQAYANLMLDLAPSGPAKGIVENQMFKQERMGADGKPLLNAKGEPRTVLLNRERQAIVERDSSDWKTRMSTGLRPQHEVLQREQDFAGRQAEMADTAAKKKIATDFGRKAINNKADAPTTQEAIKEYRERGGDPKGLMDLFRAKALENKVTENERRAMQLKPTEGSMRKYEYYNKPGER